MMHLSRSCNRCELIAEIIPIGNAYKLATIEIIVRVRVALTGARLLGGTVAETSNLDEERSGARVTERSQRIWHVHREKVTVLWKQLRRQVKRLGVLDGSEGCECATHSAQGLVRAYECDEELPGRWLSGGLGRKGFECSVLHLAVVVVITAHR